MLLKNIIREQSVNEYEMKMQAYRDTRTFFDIRDQYRPKI